MIGHFLSLVESLLSCRDLIIGNQALEGFSEVPLLVLRNPEEVIRLVILGKARPKLVSKGLGENIRHRTHQMLPWIFVLSMTMLGSENSNAILPDF